MYLQCLVKVFPPHSLNVLLTGERLNFSANTIQYKLMWRFFFCFVFLTSIQPFGFPSQRSDGVNDLNISQAKETHRHAFVDVYTCVHNVFIICVFFYKYICLFTTPGKFCRLHSPWASQKCLRYFRDRTTLPGTAAAHKLFWPIVAPK